MVRGPANNQQSIRVLRFLKTCASGYFTGAAGVNVSIVDPEACERWTQNVLRTIYELYKPRSDDVSVTWLRPGARQDRLEVAQASNLREPPEHYKFYLGVGLAGKVWEAGKPAAHSPDQEHEWWEVIDGCENMTYICAPVGRAAGIGGVVGVGSDSGFDLASDDAAVVEAFASLIAGVSQSVGLTPDRRRSLAREAEALEAQVIAGGRVDDSVANDFNELLVRARRQTGGNARLDAIRPVTPPSPNTSGDRPPEVQRRIQSLRKALSGK